MYQQLINLELKTDSNGAIHGFGKASILNLQNKIQIPLLEDYFPCFMCNLCNNILSINVFVSVHQQQQQEFQLLTPLVVPLVNILPEQPLESQEEVAIEQPNDENGEESDNSEENSESEQDEDSEEESLEEQEENETEQEGTLSDSILTSDEANFTLISEIPFETPSTNVQPTNDTLPADSMQVSYEPTSNVLHPYSCDTCKRSYKTRFARYHHYKKQECSRPLERKRPPYTCEICNKTLTTRRGYLLHMKNETKHAKQNEKLECPDCQKLFKTKVGLRMHRFLHLKDEERPFQCHICKRGFASKLSFQIHELVHTKGKKYPCTICEESFDVKEELRKHLETHAEELGEELHNCDCADGRISSKGVECQKDHQSDDSDPDET